MIDCKAITSHVSHASLRFIVSCLDHTQGCMCQTPVKGLKKRSGVSFCYQLFYLENKVKSQNWSLIKDMTAPGALAHCLQRRNACKFQNGRYGAPKWPTGSGKVQLLLNKFFYPSTPSRRKVDNGEEKKSGEKKTKQKKTRTLHCL